MSDGESGCKLGESNSFNQIQLIIYLPDCVHEPEVYKHGTQMIKKGGFRPKRG